MARIQIMQSSATTAPTQLNNRELGMHSNVLYYGSTTNKPLKVWSEQNLKFGYSSSGTNYKVSQDSSGNAFVAVPWTNTAHTHSAGEGLSITGSGGATAETVTYSLKAATTSALGGLKIVNTANPTLPTATSTASRYYGLQSTSAGVGFVNVPWENTAHKHAVGAGLTISGSGGVSDTTTFGLAAATASTIGGIKVGTNLLVTTDGTLSAVANVAGSYAIQFTTSQWASTSGDGAYKFTYNFSTGSGQVAYTDINYAVEVLCQRSGDYIEAPCTVVKRRGAGIDIYAEEAFNGVLILTSGGAGDSQQSGHIIQNSSGSSLTGTTLKFGTNLNTSVANGIITITATDTNTAHAHTAGDGLQITSSTSGGTGGTTTYAHSVPSGASASTYSGGKITSITTDKFGHVTSVSTGTDVDTKYTAGNGLTLSSTNQFSLNCPTGTGTRGGIKPWIYYSSSSTYNGGTSAPSTQSGTVSVQTLSTISNRYYAVATDVNGRPFVNVPWTDTTVTPGNGTLTLESGGLISLSTTRSFKANQSTDTTITLTHGTPLSATDKTYGTTTASSPSFGTSFTVPYVTTDSYGHVNGGGTRNVTLPSVPSSGLYVGASGASSNSAQANNPYLVLRYNGTSYSHQLKGENGVQISSDSSGHITIQYTGELTDGSKSIDFTTSNWSSSSEGYGAYRLGPVGSSGSGNFALALPGLRYQVEVLATDSSYKIVAPCTVRKYSSGSSNYFYLYAETTFAGTIVITAGGGSGSGGATYTGGTGISISTANVISTTAASSSASGHVSTGTQTFAGRKTFNGGINIPSGATIQLNGSSGTAGYVLTSNGTSSAPSWKAIPSGSGSSYTAGTGISISSSNVISTNAASSSSVGHVTTDLQTFAGRKTFNGGINIPSGATIQLSGVSGSEGQVLTSHGTSSAPTWETPSSGGGGTSTNTMTTNTAQDVTAKKVFKGYYKMNGTAASTDQATQFYGLRVKGDTNYGAQLNFGDGDYVYFKEYADDKLQLHTKNFDFDGLTEGLMLNGDAGQAGQVLMSRGSSAAPVWGSAGSSSSSGVTIRMHDMRYEPSVETFFFNLDILSGEDLLQDDDQIVLAKIRKANHHGGSRQKYRWRTEKAMTVGDWRSIRNSRGEAYFDNCEDWQRTNSNYYGTDNGYPPTFAFFIRRDESSANNDNWVHISNTINFFSMTSTNAQRSYCAVTGGN